MIPFLFLKEHKLYRVDSTSGGHFYSKTTVLDLEILHHNEAVHNPLESIRDIVQGDDGKTYILTQHAIYSCNPTTNKTDLVYARPQGFEAPYIARGAMRNNNLYFSAIKGVTTTYNRVGSQTTAFPFCTLERKDLLLPPDPEHGCTYPEDYEVEFAFNPTPFSFDEDGNIHASNGYGYWRLLRMGSGDVFGEPRRLHLNYKQRSAYLVCRDSNTLYSLSISDSHPGHEPEFPYVVIRRIDLLPPPVTDVVVFSKNNQTQLSDGPGFPEFDGEVEGFKLLPGSLALRYYLMPADIEWVQRSLNAVFPPSPLLAIDGHLGPLTRGAVRAFQKHWLPSEPVDGIPGPLTRAKLIQVLKAHFSG